MHEVMREPMDASRPAGFAVLRVPFFLEPDYPEDSSFEETNLNRLQRKWGGKAEFEAQKNRHRLKERGHEVGIPRFDNQRTASNTMASHRLVQWVTREYGSELAEKLYQELNYNHFELGQKLNDEEFLARAAASVGVSRDDALHVIRNGVGREYIQAAQKLLRRMGIHSIPTFIVDGKYVLGGAVPARELVELFRSIETSPDEESGGFVFAEALGIPAERLAESLPMPDRVYKAIA
ncbi:DSBA domain-containing protein [Pycnococcus provasolii]